MITLKAESKGPSPSGAHFYGGIHDGEFLQFELDRNTVSVTYKGEKYWRSGTIIVAEHEGKQVSAVVFCYDQALMNLFHSAVNKKGRKA